MSAHEPTESGMGSPAAVSWTRIEPMPKVTFGIIVLNGEPFTRYCLRSLYPFAHEIIVVEGGHEDTRAVATPDGHSIDGTLDTLKRFKQEEDPEGKITIVTRNGFWPKKDEMGRHRTAQSRAYAERATGDYLWQVDIDEFYRAEDMRAVLEMLTVDPGITAVSFRAPSFWGSPDIEVNAWALQRGLRDYDRLFKWGPDYRYVTHEPPTVVDAAGRDLKAVNWIRAEEMDRRGINMYHYALLFPWQVEQKTRLYEDESHWYAGIRNWADTCYFRLDHPYHVYHMRHLGAVSWLRRYQGERPAQITSMMEDVLAGRVDAVARDNRDVDRLLASRWYRVGAVACRYLDYGDRLRLRAEWVAVKIRRAPRRLVREVRARTRST
jgi:hypothetical protein